MMRGLARATVPSRLHIPQPPGLGRVPDEGDNGFWLRSIQTARFPGPIRITARNQQVTVIWPAEKNVMQITSVIDPAHTTNPAGGLSCSKCHNDVGHIE